MLRSVYATLTAGTNYMTHEVGNQELWLLAANIEVADAAGNSTRNAAANIWIQAINEANAFSIADGNLRNGTIQGFGCLPLLRGHEVKAAIYHATAGEIAKLNIVVVTTQEALAMGMNLTPNWHQRVDALPVFASGKLRVIEVDGAADDVDPFLQPSDGYIWRVLDAYCYHDDGTNRSFTWQVTDGTNVFSKTATGTIIQGVQCWLYPEPLAVDAPTCPEAYVISYDVYIKAVANALTAGKHVFIRAFVQEYCE